MKQRRAAICLALLFIMSHAGHGQGDHAPTVAMCQADMHLWKDQVTEYNVAETDYINKGLPDRSTLMGMTYQQLNNRAYEMGQCAVVDPSLEDEYNSELRYYSDIRDERFKFFVRRHNLLKQVLAAEGVNEFETGGGIF